MTIVHSSSSVEAAMQHLQDLRGVDYTPEEYRIDQLKVIDPSHEILTLSDCLQYTRTTVS